MRLRRQVTAATATVMVAAGLTALATGPTQATAVGDARATLAAGNTYSVIIGTDGRPYGAGRNDEHQLTGNQPGYEQRPTLTAMTGLPSTVSATAVAAAQDHTLVLGSNGVAYGTGNNGIGALGAAPLFRVTLTPIPVPGGVAITAVAAGGFGHSLLLGANGTAYGLGDNNDGQITGAEINKTASTPLTGLPGGVAAAAVAAGLSHSLVLGSDQTVYGTGRNHVGQLTGGGDRSTLTAMPLPGGVAATAIAAGRDHSLAIGANGMVYGVGANGSGQLAGAANPSTAWQAMALPAGVTARGISAGAFHSLVLGSDGVAYGTGSNAFDQLTAASPKPTTTALTAISGSIASPIIEVVSGAGSFTTLLRDADGVVHGIGRSDEQQLTTAVPGPTAPSPIVLAGQPITVVAGPAFVRAPRVGAPTRLTAATWSPTPTAVTYQWLVAGAPVAGATGPRFTPRPRDRGKTLAVQVSAVRSGLTTGSVVLSAPVARGVAPKLRTKRTRIVGQPRVGARLRLQGARPKDFSPRPTKLRYQWLRGKRPIRGATKRFHRVQPADRGSVLRVRVRAQRTGHAPSVHRSRTLRIPTVGR